MASLRTAANTEKHMCAGSLIHRGQWIITARYCLLVNGTRESHTIYTIPAYSRFMDRVGRYERIAMEKSFCHPFIKDKPDVYTDIGLIKLQRPVPLKHFPTDNDLIKIHLLREDFEFAPHIDEVTTFVSGWGTEGGTHKEPQNRIVAEFFSIKNPSVCKDDPLSVNFNYPNHICLRAKDVWAAPCYGDEGGPAHYWKAPEWALMGVVPGIPYECR